MDFSEFFKVRNPPKLHDELVYEFIAEELSSGLVKSGLWTKALADAEWDDAKAKTFYVRMRFTQVKEEFEIAIQNEKKKKEELVRARGELSLEEIDYLGKPIKASSYLAKYRISEKKLSSAIGLKKIRALVKDGVLWVNDWPLSG